MTASTARNLAGVLVAALGLLLPARSLLAADIEAIVLFGEGEPVSEFQNAQPSSAVTSFSSGTSQHLSAFSWGTGGARPFLMSFGGPAGELLDQGVRFDADFGKVFSIGRLLYSRGITASGEATGADLQIAIALNKPAGLPGSLVITLPLTIATFRGRHSICRRI